MTNHDDTAGQFDYVPVPRQHVPAVYRLLAELTTYRARDGVVNEDGAGAAGEWTDDMLRKLASGETTSTQALTDILDVLAENPGTWYSQDDLAESTGRSRGQLLVVWTKLTPHFAKHYGTSEWPVETASGGRLTPPRQNSVHYSVTPARAAQWRRIRSS